MSVRMKFYTVLGSYVPYNREFSDMLDETDAFNYHQSETGYVPDIVLDLMSSEYMIFGKILFAQDDEGDGDSFTEIDPDTFYNHELNYRMEFAEKFPDWTHLLGDSPFKLYSFAHYS